MIQKILTNFSNRRHINITTNSNSISFNSNYFTYNVNHFKNENDNYYILTSDEITTVSNLYNLQIKTAINLNVHPISVDSINLLLNKTTTPILLNNKMFLGDAFTDINRIQYYHSKFLNENGYIFLLCIKIMEHIDKDMWMVYLLN